jgi:hypothetical protein
LALMPQFVVQRLWPSAVDLCSGLEQHETDEAFRPVFD